MLYTYDPKLVVYSFRGLQITGFAVGSMIIASRNEDAFTMAPGAVGDVTRVRSRNRTGSIIFNVIQSAPANSVLSAIHAEDELIGTGVGPSFLKDLNGTTIIEAPESWIRKYPDAEFGTDETPREWIVDCAELIMLVGGANS